MQTSDLEKNSMTDKGRPSGNRPWEMGDTVSLRPADASDTAGDQTVCDPAMVEDNRSRMTVANSQSSESWVENPFRTAGENGHGIGRVVSSMPSQAHDDLRAYVNSELEGTKQMLLQQQSTLATISETIKQLSQSQRQPGKRKLHELSSSSESEYYSPSDSDEPEDESVSFIGSVASSHQTADAPSKLDKLNGLFIENSQVCEMVNEKLAETINRGLSQPLDTKLAFELAEKFKCPENCTFLSVPKLNEELFQEDSIESRYKKNDVFLQKNQLLLTKGMIPLVQMLDVMIKDHKGDEALFDLATNSLQLLAFAHRDMSNVRRQFLKPSVQKKYQRLCRPDNPLSSQLFGDDLEKQLKSINESKKIGTQMASSSERRKKHKTEHRGYSRQGYHRSANQRRSEPFLDRRYEAQNRGRKSFNKKRPGKNKSSQ